MRPGDQEKTGSEIREESNEPGNNNNYAETTKMPIEIDTIINNLSKLTGTSRHSVL